MKADQAQVEQVGSWNRLKGVTMGDWPAERGAPDDHVEQRAVQPRPGPGKQNAGAGAPDELRVRSALQPGRRAGRTSAVSVMGLLSKSENERGARVVVGAVRRHVRLGWLRWKAMRTRALRPTGSWF